MSHHAQSVLIPNVFGVPCLWAKGAVDGPRYRICEWVAPVHDTVFRKLHEVYVASPFFGDAACLHKVVFFLAPCFHKAFVDEGASVANGACPVVGGDAGGGFHSVLDFIVDPPDFEWDALPFCLFVAEGCSLLVVLLPECVACEVSRPRSDFELAMVVPSMLDHCSPGFQC